MTTNRQLNETAALKWVAKLKSKDSDAVRTLLGHVERDDPSGFVKYVEDTLSVHGKDPFIGDGLPSFFVDDGKPVVQLTPGSIKSMPAEDVAKFYAHLAHIPFEMATSPYFWGALTLSLLEDKLIRPLWLAHHDPTGQGNSVIDKIQKAKDDPKTADSLMRRVIRSLFAPGLFRGAPEMYSDCALARAWWCGYLSANCAKVLAIDKLQATQALAAMWSVVAIYLSGRLTVVREVNNTSALIQWYIDKNNANMNNDLIVKAVLSLGQLSSCHMINFHDPKYIAKQLTLITG